jgi:2-amino-4-hydroxy-6-hydroxymethyldihydropteridine diphosphokinase
MKATAFLGLGSNLGDRRKQLAQALRKLGDDPAIAIVRGSSVYETKPVGMVDQPDFLNMVVQVETSCAPLALLSVCLGIEAGLGRERRQRWGPRTIDLDILLYDQVKLNDERLVLPHPRMHERSFVLSPLAEIAPELQLRGKTVREAALGVGMAGLRRVETWADFSSWAKISPNRPGET